MSWLPKRDKLDPVQASAIDFAVAQERRFYIKGEAGAGSGRTGGDRTRDPNIKSVVLYQLSYNPRS